MKNIKFKRMDDESLIMNTIHISPTLIKQYEDDRNCHGTKKDGKKCRYRSVYMGFCRIHGKHIMKEEQDPFVLFQTKSLELARDRIIKNRLNVNYVKDGKTVIHRLLTHTEEIGSIRAYCSTLVRGDLDINKTSIDSFCVNGTEYIDMEISPIVFLLYVSPLPLERKETIIRRLSPTMNQFDFDRVYFGKHILTRALDQGSTSIIEKAISVVDGDFLKTVTDSDGNTILFSFMKRFITKRGLSHTHFMFIKDLFSNRVLANLKDKQGAIPAITMLRRIKFPTMISRSHWDFLGASDKSLTDNNSVSLLERPEYKELGFESVYDYIKVLKRNQRDETGKLLPRPQYSRNAIRSLIDIIFTLKLIVKRREKGMCRLVGNKIQKHLIDLYA